MWSWKNLVGYAGVAVGIVLVSFIVEWHIRTGWQIHWADGLIRWWADFVMFGWVQQYQTLLAGILAVAAGAFAFLAAMYQRRAALYDRQAERYHGAISTLYVVRGLFQRMILHGWAPDFPAMRADLTEIRGNIVAITHISAGLADWLQFILHDAEESIDEAERRHGFRHDGSRADYAIALAVIAKCFLTDAERLFATGPYRHVPRRMDKADAITFKATRSRLERIPLTDGMVLPFEGKI